ncbi:MAG: peptidylprolyl isomerase [Clostridia bacterium]|nr:peptidylprolyl isomerase [Clostridia bacterium]
MQRKLFALMMALVMALSFAAVAEQETETTTPSTSTVLAIANGSEITLGDISGAYQYLATMYQSYGIDVSSEEMQQSLSSYALNMLIQEKIILDNASKLGLDALTDEQMAELTAEAEASYENSITTYKSYFASAGLTEDEVRANTIAYFDSEGYTIDSIVESLKGTKTYENVYEYAIKDISVTDDEIRAAYDEGLADAQERYAEDLSQYDSDVSAGNVIYVVPEGLRNVKHILVGVDDAAELKTLQATLETLTEADEEYQATVDRIAEIMATVQPTLDEIAGRIEAGEEFQTLIDEYGEDGGMKSGTTAETGYTMSADTTQFVSEFKDAGMALENVGDISEPVLSDYGFHILRYESDVAPGIVPFEDLRDDIASSLESSRQSQAYNDLINEWISNAEIIYPENAAE